MSKWQSMTGYAELNQTIISGASLSIQIRSVNHKNIDLRVWTQPKNLAWEHEVQQQVRQKFSRGKFDVQIRVDQTTEVTGIDLSELNRLKSKKWLTEIALQEPLRPHNIESLMNKDGDQVDVELDAFMPIFGQVLDLLIENRQIEGLQLNNCIKDFLPQIQELRSQLEDQAKTSIADKQAYVTHRIQELDLSSVSPERVAEEAAILLMRGDITEELDRIDMHVERLRTLVSNESPVGKELDVLAQELGREAHTCASKASDSKLKQTALELRLLVDQLREQVQNIE